MKIEFDEKEKEIIKKNRELEESIVFNKDSIGNEYAFSFIVTDNYKAEAFFYNFLLGLNNGKMEDDFGIRITSLNLKPPMTEERKSQMINELIDVINKYK